MKITFAQKMLLRKYRIPMSDDRDTLLEAIEERINEIGYSDELDEFGDEEMNEAGKELDDLYDILVMQNLRDR